MSSVSFTKQLFTRYFMVVSKLILRKGELLSSIPILLKARYSPLKVMKSPIKLRWRQLTSIPYILKTDLTSPTRLALHASIPYFLPILQMSLVQMRLTSMMSECLQNSSKFRPYTMIQGSFLWDFSLSSSGTIRVHLSIPLIERTNTFERSYSARVSISTFLSCRLQVSSMVIDLFFSVVMPLKLLRYFENFSLKMLS